jgi:MFS family permease
MVESVMGSASTGHTARVAGEAATTARYPRAAFALLGTIQVTLIAAMTVISVALSTIQHELNLTTSELALVNNAYPVSFCGLLLFGGRLGDLFGRRMMFVLGTGIFAAGSATAGLAPGLVPLLLARFGQGCGAALAAPAALALLSVVFPDPRRRTRAVAVWGGLPVAGATAGLLLSGVVVQWASWRWAFTVPVLIALAAIALAPRLLPASPPSASQRLDVVGAVLATVGLSALCYGLVEIGEQLSTSSVVALAGGIALLITFVVVESRTREPLVPLGFFVSLRRATGLVAVVLASSGTTALTFFLPLYFQQVQGFSPAGTSAAFVPYGLAMFATGWFTARLVARTGHRIATVAGLLLGALGLFLVSGLTVDTPYVGVVLAGMVVFPIGVSLLFSGGTVAAVDNVPDDQSGLAGGVLNTAMEGGPALGLAVLVSLAAAHTTGLREAGVLPAAAATDGYGFALEVAAVSYALIAAVAAITLRTRRTHRNSNARDNNARSEK